MLKLDISPNGKAGNGFTHGHPSHVDHVKRKKRKPHHPYQSARRHFRNGERAAVTRALAAARSYRAGFFTTVGEAAVSHGSCPAYISAAVIILESENSILLNQVRAGHVGLLTAARDVQRLANLVKAFRSSTVKDHAAFAKLIGSDRLFDDLVVPAL